MRSLSKIFLLAFAVMIFGSAGPSHGMDFPIASPLERFEKRLDEVEGYLDIAAKKKGVENQMRYLDRSGIRDVLTELQNLFWLYSKRYGRFRRFRDVMKDLEDHISHLGDYKKYLRYAEQVDADTEQRYKEKLDHEISLYRNYLKNSDWLKPGHPLIRRIREELRKTDWPSLEADRNYLLKRVAKKLKKMHREEYDFNLVEEGWHELRRDVRRFEYLNDAMDGLVTPSPDIACPLGGPVNGRKKDRARKQDAYNCHVAPCLVKKLSQADDELLELKKAGAWHEASGKDIPPGMYERVKKIHTELIESKVYLHLASQLKDCRTAEAR